MVQVRGEAEAFAIEAKARAEAEQMTKKADAWRDYQEAAMVDMLLDTLPKVYITISGNNPMTSWSFAIDLGALVPLRQYMIVISRSDFNNLLMIGHFLNH